MTRHRKIHINKNSHACDICQKEFLRKDGLSAHINTHLKIRSYQCDKCPESFYSSSSLSKHKNKHKGGFECKVCGKGFARKYFLERHEKEVHVVHASFSCDKCGHTFKRKACLEVHIATNTREDSYYCNVCYEDFSSKCLMIKHRVQHSKERSYQCSFCAKIFNRYSTMKEHERSHGEVKFTCDLCPKSFAWSRSLRRHIQKDHQTQGMWLLLIILLFFCTNFIFLNQIWFWECN